MSTQLTKSAYQQLLTDISYIYQEAKERSNKIVDSILTKAYWEIGKKIVEIDQGGQERASYDKQIIEKLSEGLTERLGKGFSVENLRKMRRFYISYPIRSAPTELDWTRYKVLSAVKEDYKRTYYEREAIKNDWSSRDLIQVIKADRVAHEPFREHTEKPQELMQDPKLKMTRGALYTYSLIESEILNKSDKAPKLLVDCGFGVARHVIEHFEGFSSGDIIESRKSNKFFKIMPSSYRKDELFTYIAYVSDIIDGDTIWCQIDLGFGTWTKQKLRFRGIDASEINTQRGERAREFVKKELKSLPFIIVKTYKEDKYGRYLADIFYSDTSDDPEDVATHGKFLNQILVDGNLAKIYNY
ncbi:MAG: DUF1016 N-terminal domain-containing protein [Candidatus Zapsychrus exili]|nr:DUF1016 N-terminal domain-containing protein [Candidatus Zapsychrus exili]